MQRPGTRGVSLSPPRGMGGNDTLSGSVGADTLEGGFGSNDYVMDTIDVLIEVVGQGTDTVRWVCRGAEHAR